MLLSISSSAQSRLSDGYLLVSVSEPMDRTDYIYSSGWMKEVIASYYHVIVTKGNGTQEKRKIKVTPQQLNQEGAEDKFIIEILRPYFDAGWKLISCTTEVIPLGGGDNISSRKVEKYFLTK